jgi:hypothetical protein
MYSGKIAVLPGGGGIVFILRKRYMHVRVFTTIGEDHYHHHYIVFDTLICIYQKQSFKIKRIRLK